MRAGRQSRHGGRLRDGYVDNPLAVQGIANPRLFPLLLVQKIIPFRFLDFSDQIILRSSVHINFGQAFSILADDALFFRGTGLQAG